MRIVLLITLLVFVEFAFGQSKKEQIEILANRADSLNLVLNSTRNANNKKEIEYKEQILSLQKQFEDLNNSLTKAKEDLLKKELELNTSNQELKNKLLEITVLKNQINEKDLQIANLKLELNNLKTSLNNIQNDEIVKTDFFQSVTIGKQIWMTENLNVAAFRNGDPIKEAKTPEEWEKAEENKQPAWCYYDNDPANGAKYGKLYNWCAVSDKRGLAPVGYHIPSDVEWTKLEGFLGSDAGTKMKSKSRWNSYTDEEEDLNSGNGTNTSGFSGVPGGYRGKYGGFYSIGEYGTWWSSTEYSTGVSCGTFRVFSYISRVSRERGGWESGFSVRCIKD